MPLMAVSFLASCGPATYTVSLGEIDGISIDSTKATQGKDYVATISVDTETSDGILSDTLNKVTVGKKELTSSDYTYIVHEDRLSADFTIPKANVTGNIVININLLSFKIDNQDEYETAMKLENVSYLQISGKAKMPFEEKYSPTVYYRHNIQEGKYQDLEYYVEHAADDIYWYYVKEDQKWTKTEAPAPAMFKIPSDFAREHNLIDTIENYPYNTLTYENGYYIINASEGEITYIITLQFLNKKLVFCDMLGNESHKYFYFSYEEVTPELPIPDPTL